MLGFFRGKTIKTQFLGFSGGFGFFKVGEKRKELDLGLLSFLLLLIDILFLISLIFKNGYLSFFNGLCLLKAHLWEAKEFSWGVKHENLGLKLEKKQWEIELNNGIN